MRKEKWYEVEGKSYLLHIIALVGLIILNGLGN
jgi:hypothetical protein